MSQVLLYYGLGRTVRTEEQERRLFDHPLGEDVADWRWRHETACASFLLSRSESAPELLESRSVAHKAEVILDEFSKQLGGPYMKFNCAPFLMTGLLRHRERKRYALVIGEDLIADRFREAIHETLADFERPRSHARFEKKVGKYRPILLEIDRWLDGKGENPDILEDIFDTDSPPMIPILNLTRGRTRIDHPGHATAR